LIKSVVELILKERSNKNISLSFRNRLKKSRYVIWARRHYYRSI